MAYTIRCNRKNVSQEVFTDLFQLLTQFLSKSRFTAEIGTKFSKVITFSCIRLRERKDYCGNHPLPCPVRPGPHKPHKHTKQLEGADWVAFNDMVNDACDQLAVEANAGSSLVTVRKGLERCIEYTAYQLSNGIDNEWEREGHFANCIGEPTRAKYPEGTPGFDYWRRENA